MKNYQNVIFNGATFPDSPYKINTVHPNDTILKEYLPTLKSVLPDGPKGLSLLITAQAIQEGFKAGTRSYTNHNPGNIGQLDNGQNHPLTTLADGIKLQISYIQGVASGTNKNYPLNKDVFLKPGFSQEIANNPQYQLGNGYFPGYKFNYTGQLDEYVKIYATGARLTNSYINLIVSYFSQNGLTILPTSKIQDIIKMN